MTATRRLAAILAADVAGYSRLMGTDEEGTHERVQAHRREFVDPKITEHSGRIVKTIGDRMLVEFPSVVDAVRCAAELQRAMIDREAGIPEDLRIRFRVGINLGEVIVEDEDIFGDGVNVAARLEALAEPGGLCISRTVRDHIRDKLAYAFEDLGEQSVKNIARPVRVYTLRPEAVADLPAPRALPTPPISQPAVPRLSIVVLPFANLSIDPEQQYFADAITDDLTTDLSRIADSFVIARTTAFTYKGKAVDVSQIARELGVRYLLEGSARRMGERVQVNVQLIDGASGSHVWADRFDTDRRDLAEAQSEITGRLARTLDVELVRDAGRRIEHERAADPDARDLVMRARALFIQRTSAAVHRQALELLERALILDPGSTNARILIANILVSDIADALSSSVAQDEARAEQLIREALECDPNRSQAHLVIGLLRRVQGRWAETQAELDTAIALDQNNAPAIHQLGMTLLIQGNPETAIPYLEKGIRLDPRAPFIFVGYANLAGCHLFLGRTDEAVDLYRKARVLNPGIWYVHILLAGALGLRGDIDEAKSEITETLKLNQTRIRSHDCVQST
jgi:adenylate cyclase